VKLFRWSGALLFVLSLLSFAVVYGWRLRTPAPTSDDAMRDAIANVVLFTVFALHHSIMARTGAKAWITGQLPPGLERSVYVWIASALFLAVCWMWQPLPGVIWKTRGPGLALYVAQAFGVALTLAAARIVGLTGYGSEEHRLAIRRLGPSPIHRRSFGDVSQRWLFS